MLLIWILVNIKDTVTNSIACVTYLSIEVVLINWAPLKRGCQEMTQRFVQESIASFQYMRSPIRLQLIVKKVKTKFDFK